MPASSTLSVYRGQAKSGIGEGPSIPVAHGEQYLEGTAEAFRDDDILREIRPWLTLDSDSADHQRLQDRLEGWSCFCAAGRVFVARLASAGIYDRRAAYFSHARAWPLEQCLDSQDPGVYLGCSEVFDASLERQGLSDKELEALAPEAVPKRWLPVLQANAPAASAFLGHLLQAVERGYPVLVAAPVAAFTPGSEWFALAAFARAALPAELKPRCSLRLYTRQPERFARHLGAHLIVLPEDSVADAMAACGQATLLDAQGKLLKTANPLEPAAQAYAQVAVSGTLNAPQGLLPFSALIRKQKARGLQAGGNVALLQLSYLLAMALAGGAEDCAEVFGYITRTQGPGLPWDVLLDDGDWARFPHSVLAGLVLSPKESLKNPVEQELQSFVIGVMGRLGLGLDGALAGWWQADDRRKLGRLAELVEQAPGLFADPAALMEKIQVVPLSQWQQASPSLCGLLKLEFEAGRLGRRSGEWETLADLAKTPAQYAVLAAATAAGQLGIDWAERFVRQAQAEDAGTLLLMVRDWLDSPAVWKGVGLTLVDCLRRLRTPLPPEVADKIAGLAQTLDIAKDLDIYLRLADVLEPADSDSGDFSANPLMQALLPKLHRLDSREARKRIVAAALDASWRCLAPASLLVLATAAPWPVWKDVLADVLLRFDPLLDALPSARLLECLREAGPRLDRERINKVYARISQHFRENPEQTVTALIESGAWLGWRREAVLTDAERRQAALAWLSSPLWQESPAPEATLESWKQAVADLAPRIGSEDMRRLRLGKDGQGGAAWPWVSRFQEEQLADIARLAQDLGVLAEFAEAVRKTCEHSGNPVEPIRAAFAAFKQAHAEDMPAAFGPDALLWLMTPLPAQAEPLGLEASYYLYARAGHRRPAAFQARLQSVSAAFNTQPLQALEAMDEPNLWQERAFIDPWAVWLGNLPADSDFLAHLDLYFLSSKKQLPFLYSSERINAAERLKQKGYKEIARLLNPEVRENRKPTASAPRPGGGPQQSVSLPGLAGEVYQSLTKQGSGDALWGRIAQGSFPPGGHPFIELAQFDDILGFFRHTRWDNVLREALSKNPGLLQPFAAEYPRLPAFELYSCLVGEGGIATAITSFVRFVYNHHSDLQLETPWWGALLESIEVRCRNQPGNNAEAALTGLCRAVNNNVEGKSDPDKRRFSLQINQALYRALVATGHKDKARLLISE